MKKSKFSLQKSLLVAVLVVSLSVIASAVPLIINSHGMGSSNPAPAAQFDKAIFLRQEQLDLKVFVDILNFSMTDANCVEMSDAANEILNAKSDKGKLNGYIRLLNADKAYLQVVTKFFATASDEEIKKFFEKAIAFESVIRLMRLHFTSALQNGENCYDRSLDEVKMDVVKVNTAVYVTTEAIIAMYAKMKARQLLSKEDEIALMKYLKKENYFQLRVRANLNIIANDRNASSVSRAADDALAEINFRFKK